MKSKIQNIIEKLDALINFYDPDQARDESGKWSGSGGGSSKYGHSFVSDSEADRIKNSSDTQSVVADHLDKAVEDAESDDPEVSKAIDSANEAVNKVGKFVEQDSPKNYYSRLRGLVKEISNISDGLTKSDSKTARRNSDAFGALAETISEIGEIFRQNISGRGLAIGKGVERSIKKLDSLIKFYDPSQARDEAGRWSGSGSGSWVKAGPNEYGPPIASDEEIRSEKEKWNKQSIQEHIEKGVFGHGGIFDWKESVSQIADGLNKAFKGSGIKVKNKKDENGVLVKVYDELKEIGQHYADKPDGLLSGLKSIISKSKDWTMKTEDIGDQGAYELRPKR